MYNSNDYYTEAQTDKAIRKYTRQYNTMIKQSRKKNKISEFLHDISFSKAFDNTKYRFIF